MPGDREIESCRDVYLQSCTSICEPFKADGFLYAKSGPKMSKKSGEFTFIVSFQSSRYNRPGVSVCIGIHAYVYSPAMKKWRSSNRSIGGADTCLAGGQIGNLRKKQSWMEWDVASTELRGGKIQLAIDAVRNIALPYFAAFDISRALNLLRRNEQLDRVFIADCRAVARAIIMFELDEKFVLGR